VSVSMPGQPSPIPSRPDAAVVRGDARGDTLGVVAIDAKRMRLIEAETERRNTRVVLDVVDASLTRSKRLREEAAADRAEREARAEERDAARAERERLLAEQAERRARSERALEEAASKRIDLTA